MTVERRCRGMTRQEAISRLKAIITEATTDENSMCHVTNEDKKALEIAIQSIRTLRAIELIYRKQPKQKIDW